MNIKHFLGTENWQKEVEGGRSFLLGNDLGDYLWLANTPTSRYQGWFIAPKEERGNEFKIIEDIRPVNRREATNLENYFSRVKRSGPDFEETFSLCLESHKFIYQLKEERKVELILDMRESYSDDYPDYEIEDLGDIILIKAKEVDLYLSIKGFDSFELIEERFVRSYEKDKERSSPPFEKAVFKALNMTGEKFTFGAGTSKEEALDALSRAVSFKNFTNRREPVDFVAAETGLDNLLVDGRNIYAGFPWFFQFWQRDEAISLRGLKIIKPKEAKEVFWSLVNRNSKGPRGNKIADGVGWTFKRAFLFLNELTEKEEDLLVKRLREKVDFNRDGFMITDYKETWMDSISRKGARIELQALQLAIYKLGKLIDDKNSDLYQRKEVDLKRKVRDKFWDGSILADGYDPEADWTDKTIRPNIFLAYYIYPDLLSDEEWEACFRRSLYDLWLDWGGLATVSKRSPAFQSEHTGENPQSYHQGDSWFFVNNLAAIAMNRLNSGKFSYEINKILKASREDLLWNGAIGHHSEVSSASALRAQGAISQAWSFATYLEAMYEVFKIKNFNWS